MEVDPAALSNAEWAEISKLLISLWIFVVVALTFAGTLVLGHVLIPSLVDSHHVPESLLKLRPPLYMTAILFFAVAMFFIFRATDLYGVMYNIYQRWWI